MFLFISLGRRDHVLVILYKVFLVNLPLHATCGWKAAVSFVGSFKAVMSRLKQGVLRCSGVVPAPAKGKTVLLPLVGNP